MEEKHTREENGFSETGRPGLSLIIAVAFSAALFGGLIATYAVPYLYGSTPGDVYSGHGSYPVTNSKEIINVAKGSISPVAAVAKKLQPSIVNINIKQTLKDMAHPDVVSGAGSGVIFNSDGYIITNAHVVSDAKDIFVTIGTEELKGKLVAADKDSDLAVVKVNRTGLPAAEFGSTKNLQVGDLAVAIGSPFGFEHTVTSGIVSALNRTLSLPDENSQQINTYTNLIQTDAPINPGNSGGALSDSQGRVIGINTLIVSSTGVTEGIGFAIPVETAVTVARQLIDKGKASHPYMGIQGQNANNTLPVDNTYGVAKGAIVTDVVKRSPADKAGLREKDIIVAADGKPVDTMDDLIAQIRQKKVGDTLYLTFLRNGKQKTVSVILVEKPKR
ncbi:MAG: S1C family serine protease [Candidatus Aquicultor sp.]